MRYIIYGAGGIGGTIGAMLLGAGAEVLFIARGNHGERLRNEGLRFISPSGSAQLAVDAALHPSEVKFREGDAVLLCVKSQQSQTALEDLRAASAECPELAVICAQNGVHNEALALRYFRRVYAMLVLLPATHLTPGEVVCSAASPAGVLDSGRYPRGVDGLVETLCADLRSAGFSATVDARVMRKKYSKLLANLINSVQAMLPLNQVEDAPVQALLQQLRQEALDCYAAAGIECASKAEFQALAAQLNYQPVPGFDRLGGSSWQSLKRGTGDIEADYLNGEIVRLGRLHGIATPANEACQQLAVSMARSGAAVSSLTVGQIQQRVDALA